MLESIPVTLIVGSLFGFLAGIGIGGGSLLILWLTLILGTDHNTARCINLIFFIPCALAASLFRWKQGKLPVSTILPAIISGCAMAAIFSWIGRWIYLPLLKKLFGGLLLLTGIRELCYRPRNAK